jgi:cation transporter-like permease
VLSTLALVSIICLISIMWGLYIFHKNEDPNNFLIPLTTAVADLGSMLIFGAMIVAMF